jgi:hypothetical protein
MNTDTGRRTLARNTDALSGDKLVLCPDAWSQTLLLLDRLCAKEPCPDSLDSAGLAASGRAGRPRRAEKGRRRNNATMRDMPCETPCAAAITLLERLTPRTVALRWCSASCHYGYQIWVCAKASRSGICAMSGRAIQRGDNIYRPYTRTQVIPVNVDAMIHLSAFA